MQQFKRWWYLLLVGLLGSCITPDDLADQNGVLLFEVQHILSRDVVLGDVVIVNDSSVVHIPLLYGSQDLEIELTCRMQLSPGARVLGLNPEKVVFQSGMSEQTFHVIAANGATRMWKLKLMLPNAASMEDLMAFKVLNYDPVSSYLFTDGVIRMLDTTVMIVAPEVQFPLNVTPELTLKEGASLYKMNEVGTLTFISFDDVKYIPIENKEGTIIPWRIKLQQPEMITTNDGYGTMVWKAVSFDNSQLSFNSAAPLNLEVDDQHNGLYFITPDKSTLTDNSAEVELSYTLPAYVAVAGIEQGKKIPLTLNGPAKRCYLYDAVRGTCKKWEIDLVDKESFYGGFNSFIPLQNSPAQIVIITDSIVVDNAGGVVWLPYQGVDSDFPLSVRVDYDLIANGTLSGLTRGQTLLFREATSVYSFKLTSAAHVERSWSVRLLNGGFNDEITGVTQLEVTQVASTQNKLLVQRFAEVDETNGELRIIVTDWADDLPTTFQGVLQLLPGATLDADGWNGIDGLQFNSYTDSYVVKTRSGNGNVTKSYTIKLENRARARSNETELLQFAVNSLSAGYGVSQVNIDGTNRVVTLQLASVGRGALAFIPIWSLSKGAYVEGLQQGQPFLFGNLDRVYAFTIVSEDETVRSNWQLKVDASPQLENHDFELWSDSYTVSGWASANSSFGKTMQRATHDGGYCVQLTTSTILGNVAAGSLFLGYFQIDLSQLSNTRMMTYMGIPFAGRPTAMEVDLKYNANGGDDMGSCTIELLNYVGSNFEYHSIGNEAGVTVVARGEYQTATTNGWQTVTVPLTTLNSALGVTHIHVIFSSSYRGDDLVGTIGATLSVDNVRLVY